MKSVLLVLHHEDEWNITEFDTVKEAQEHAVSSGIEEADIYTLYSQGRRPPINWKLHTDHITNVRENKKVDKAPRAGAWTDIELETLISNFKDGMSVTEIAKGLKRTYNSVYIKVKELQKNGRL